MICVGYIDCVRFIEEDGIGKYMDCGVKLFERIAGLPSGAMNMFMAIGSRFPAS